MEKINNTTILDFMKIQIVENGTAKIERKRFGLLKQNRPISKTNVTNFLQIINNGQYDDAFPILTAEATKLLKHKYELVDLDGNQITDKNASDFLIVLDGQHRITAFSQLNATKKKEEQIVVPNVRIKDLKNQNVGEYLASINLAGHSWTTADKLCVSAIVTEHELLDKVNDLIKEGFNATTAGLIYVGKRLTASQIKKMLSTKDTSMLPKDKKLKESLARAKHFLTTCFAIQGMTTRMLTKRYFIEGFNTYAIATSEEKAFEALKQLTLNDFIGVRESDEFINNLKTATSLLEEENDKE